MPQEAHANEEVRIVSASANDAAVVLEFIRKLARYERLEHEVVASEASLKEWLFGRQAIAEAVLAYVGDEAVGFAVFFANFSTFEGRPGLYLEDLFVDPAFRGLGIGKSILTYLAKLTVERGYARLEWAVLDWNQPAIDFYRRLGARPMEDWTVFRLSGQALRNLGESAEAVRL
jgi:GNAT superfamily N-acetyltransferase